MNAKQKKLVENIIRAELENGTKAARARAEKMQRYAENASDSGAFGRIVELASHTTKSRKNRVGKQGEKDTSIKFAVNGEEGYENLVTMLEQKGYVKIAEYPGRLEIYQKQ